MEIKEAIQVLKNHNEWRRFDDYNSKIPKMTDPKKLGIAIDIVVSKFENLFVDSVSQQRELLLSFDEWVNEECTLDWNTSIEKTVDTFLANNFD